MCISGHLVFGAVYSHFSGKNLKNFFKFHDMSKSMFKEIQVVMLMFWLLFIEMVDNLIILCSLLQFYTQNTIRIPFCKYEIHTPQSCYTQNGADIIHFTYIHGQLILSVGFVCKIFVNLFPFQAMFKTCPFQIAITFFLYG